MTTTTKTDAIRARIRALSAWGRGLEEGMTMIYTLCTAAWLREPLTGRRMFQAVRFRSVGDALEWMLREGVHGWVRGE